MTDDEQLRDYIKQNAPKKAKSKPKEPKAAMPEKVRPINTPLSYYKRLIIYDFIGFSVVIVLISLVAFFLLNANSDWTNDTALLLTISFGIALYAIVTVVLVKRWQAYFEWINNKYYELKGWNEFFATRSTDFWSSRLYTPISVNFHLANDSPEVHREAIKVYIKKFGQKWGKWYEEIDWEPGVGKPKDMVTNTTSFHLDISKVEIPRLIAILTRKFNPLAKLLGSHLNRVEISYEDKESVYKLKKESRDVFDRQKS